MPDTGRAPELDQVAHAVAGEVAGAGSPWSQSKHGTGSIYSFARSDTVQAPIVGLNHRGIGAAFRRGTQRLPDAAFGHREHDSGYRPVEGPVAARRECDHRIPKVIVTAKAVTPEDSEETRWAHAKERAARRRAAVEIRSTRAGAIEIAIRTPHQAGVRTATVVDDVEPVEDHVVAGRREPEHGARAGVKVVPRGASTPPRRAVEGSVGRLDERRSWIRAVLPACERVQNDCGSIGRHPEDRASIECTSA